MRKRPSVAKLPGVSRPYYLICQDPGRVLLKFNGSNIDCRNLGHRGAEKHRDLLSLFWKVASKAAAHCLLDLAAKRGKQYGCRNRIHKGPLKSLEKLDIHDVGHGVIRLAIISAFSRTFTGRFRSQGLIAIGVGYLIDDSTALAPCFCFQVVDERRFTVFAARERVIARAWRACRVLWTATIFVWATCALTVRRNPMMFSLGVASMEVPLEEGPILMDLAWNPRQGNLRYVQSSPLEVISESAVSMYIFLPGRFPYGIESMRRPLVVLGPPVSGLCHSVASPTLTQSPFKFIKASARNLTTKKKLIDITVESSRFIEDGTVLSDERVCARLEYLDRIAYQEYLPIRCPHLLSTADLCEVSSFAGNMYCSVLLILPMRQPPFQITVHGLFRPRSIYPHGLRRPTALTVILDQEQDNQADASSIQELNDACCHPGSFLFECRKGDNEIAPNYSRLSSFNNINVKRKFTPYSVSGLPDDPSCFVSGSVKNFISIILYLLTQANLKIGAKVRELGELVTDGMGFAIFYHAEDLMFTLCTQDGNKNLVLTPLSTKVSPFHHKFYAQYHFTVALKGLLHLSTATIWKWDLYVQEMEGTHNHEAITDPSNPRQTLLSRVAALIIVCINLAMISLYRGSMSQTIFDSLYRSYFHFSIFPPGAPGVSKISRSKMLLNNNASLKSFNQIGQRSFGAASSHQSSRGWPYALSRRLGSRNTAQVDPAATRANIHEWKVIDSVLAQGLEGSDFHGFNRNQEMLAKGSPIVMEVRAGSLTLPPFDAVRDKHTPFNPPLGVSCRVGSENVEGADYDSGFMKKDKNILILFKTALLIGLVQMLLLEVR
ncbi:uncharacterized protein BDR25DRAFT_360778 [Lindgomyces ingoldianus]|uniref:Uncharacterized protein n=1 Tax=Lindgomyces ingoldianus TaxID=673940 RepID=A0ACB6QE20_9PLEO|nr:uncharacterized protein BDR25DRAFT_360778 [Lindgomyces ingoldianus]KAF2465159.1 hypothetical protein BDR25DRAFT_360778 [Lindgomyces ingoldianus]